VAATFPVGNGKIGLYQCILLVSLWGAADRSVK
jgi:hypothetical protein